MRFYISLAVAVAVAFSGQGFASAHSVPNTSISAKKCAAGKALDTTKGKTRCVKRCPKTKTKKRVNKRWRCVAKKQAPGTTPALPPVPPPSTAPPPPAPATVQLTRDDVAGQQAVSGGDLLLERGSCASVTCEYFRIFFYANGVFRAYAVDWNNVSGEICRDGSKRDGNWAFQEGYTFAEQGGGVVVKLTTGDVLVFANAAPKYVYVYITDRLVEFERNPNMRDSC